MRKKILYITALVFFVASCGGTFDSVKRGLTGAKKESADEFLVQKKDPLILPPDYENLPTPDERDLAKEQISDFEKNLESLIEDETIEAGSAESSILKKIRSK